MRNTRYLLFISLFLSCGFSAAQDGLILTVNVAGAKPNTGNAIVSLFTKESYLKEPIADKTVSINATGKAEVQLENLSPGVYAVSVVYDENQDGKLNTGLFGIPTEKIGMSNNAKGRFGPPSFKQSAFKLSESIAIEILLTNTTQ